MLSELARGIAEEAERIVLHVSAQRHEDFRLFCLIDVDLEPGEEVARENDEGGVLPLVAVVLGQHSEIDDAPVFLVERVPEPPVTTAKVGP